MEFERKKFQTQHQYEKKTQGNEIYAPTLKNLEQRHRSSKNITPQIMQGHRENIKSLSVDRFVSSSNTRRR